MNTTVKKLKIHQLFCITLMFNISSVLVFRGFINSKTRLWLSVLIAGLIFNLIYIVFIKLFDGVNYDNFFSLTEDVCGKITGKVLGALLSIYAIFIATRVLNSASSLIVNVSLDKTPQILIISLIGAVSVFAIISGLGVFGKFSVISFVLISIFIAVTFLIGFDNIEWKNLFNKESVRFNDYASDITSYFAYPFAENIILIYLLPKTEKRSKRGRALIFGSVIGSLAISLISAFCLGVLGLPMFETQYYSFYSSVSVINFGELISRLEIIISVVLVLSLIIKYAVCLNFAVGYIKRFSIIKREKTVYYSLLILTSAIAALLGSRNYSLIKIFDTYKLWSWIFHLVIPIIIIVFIVVKRKKDMTH